MDVTDLLESEFINREFIEGSKTKLGIILNSGEMEDDDFNEGNKKKFTLNIDIDGKIKKYRPNRDSIFNLSEAYGKDSTNWRNKKIIFSITSVNSQKRIIASGVKDADQTTQPRENLQEN